MNDTQSSIVNQIANMSGQPLENILEDSQLGPDLNIAENEIRDLRDLILNMFSLPTDSLRITTETRVKEIFDEVEENIENN